MNQILSVEIEKEKKKFAREEQKKIIRFFAIAIIIFGVSLIGSGAYGMYKEAHKNDTPVLMSPVIQIEDISETQVKIQVEAGVNLAKVTYKWDNGAEKEIECIGKKAVEQIIDRPENSRKITVYAKDINGKELSQDKTSSIGENKDISISINVEGTKVKITAESETELSYMTYRWDDGDEERIEINANTTEQMINVPLGEHNLTVIVVDENNSTKAEEQLIKGVVKPKIDIAWEDDTHTNVLFKITAEDGIKKIEVIVNDGITSEGGETKTIDLSDRPLEAKQEFSLRYPRQEPGNENRIKIIVYSENDVTEELKVKM